MQPIARLVERRKKGQPLNVVPVRVRNEQVGAAVTRAKLRRRHQLLAEFSQARASIDDDAWAPFGADLYARSIAAVAVGLRPGHRIGAPHPPKPHLHVSPGRKLLIILLGGDRSNDRTARTLLLCRQ